MSAHATYLLRCQRTTDLYLYFCEGGNLCRFDQRILNLSILWFHLNTTMHALVQPPSSTWQKGKSQSMLGMYAYGLHIPHQPACVAMNCLITKLGADIRFRASCLSHSILYYNNHDNKNEQHAHPCFKIACSSPNKIPSITIACLALKKYSILYFHNNLVHFFKFSSSLLFVCAVLEGLLLENPPKALRDKKKLRSMYQS